MIEECQTRAAARLSCISLHFARKLHTSAASNHPFRAETPTDLEASSRPFSDLRSVNLGAGVASPSSQAREKSNRLSCQH
jgi:hypothetical protein